MKYVLILFVLFASVLPSFTQDIPVTVEINNIDVGKGTLYATVYNSAESFKKQKVLMTRTIEPLAGTVQLDLLLPTGEYVVSVYQDTNKNSKLDTNIIGMPKEPVGISNYSGKGIPGGFDKLKTVIRTAPVVLSVTMTRL